MAIIRRRARRPWWLVAIVLSIVASGVGALVGEEPDRGGPRPAGRVRLFPR